VPGIPQLIDCRKGILGRAEFHFFDIAFCRVKRSRMPLKLFLSPLLLLLIEVVAPHPFEVLVRLLLCEIFPTLEPDIPRGGTSHNRSCDFLFSGFVVADLGIPDGRKKSRPRDSFESSHCVISLRLLMNKIISPVCAHSIERRYISTFFHAGGLFAKAQLAKRMHLGAMEATKQLRGDASRTNPTC